jgi:acetyl-CoA C-acetyltransferase
LKVTATQAQEKGYFDSQIVPIELKTRKGTVTFTRDERVRPNVNRDDMAKLKAAFKKDGTVAAGEALWCCSALAPTKLGF